jgi:sulfate permease, SulP family
VSRIPALTWLRGITPIGLRGDVIAGITLAAYLLPAGLGDASLAGLPPQAGLYACLFSGLVFWLFCSSRHTAITVTSAISLMVGSTLGEIAGGDPTRFAALAAGTALLTGLIAFIAHIARAGVLVEFISETVMTGFKVGIALVLISTQLPKLCGFHGSHGNFFERIGQWVTHLGQTNWISLLLGLGALALLIAGKRWLKNRPVAVVIVIGGIVLSAVMNLGQHGVAILGVVPTGLPMPEFFPVNYQDINDLLPLALACFLLAAVESAAIGRMFASRHGYQFDANQELLGLAAANTAAGLGQGFPVGGGMSQSLVNEAGGARSPLSGLIAALIMLVVVLTCAGLLKDLPQPVLAAIVLVAVGGLIQVSVLQRLWRFDRREFMVAGLVVLGVLASGILRGVLIGVVVSLLLLLKRTARPRLAELGRVPGSQIFADCERHRENLPEPGVLVLRLEGALLYFNARHVHDRLLAELDARPGARLVVLSLGMAPHVDLAGCEVLEELGHAVHKRGAALRLAEVHGPIRDILRRGGHAGGLGPIEANQIVATVIDAWRAQPITPSTLPSESKPT